MALDERSEKSLSEAAGGEVGESGQTARRHCLAELRPGQEGVVVCLRSDDPRSMQKLMALGVLPGTALRLLRRFPAFIFQAGQAQFAVDETLASGVYLRLTG